jgi:hypothetical protein
MNTLVVGAVDANADGNDMLTRNREIEGPGPRTLVQHVEYIVGSLLTVFKPPDFDLDMDIQDD